MTGVTIAEVDSSFHFIEGTEKHFDVDTVCLAVGLNPMSQLAEMAGCAMEDNPKKAGFVPSCDEYGRTSIPGIYVAGDVSGIEEASSAMIEGRIAGVSVAHDFSYVDSDVFEEKVKGFEAALSSLRQVISAMRFLHFRV